MAVESASVCPDCAFHAPHGASFCERCGTVLPPERQTETITTEPAGSGAGSRQLFATDPKVFGLIPARFTLAVGASGILAGVIALAFGRLAQGLALLGLGCVLVGLAIEAARRWPASVTARFLVRVVDGISSRLGFARVFAGTWAGVAREVLRIRLELRWLRDELEAKQLALGGAAYQEDVDQVTALRTQMRETKRRIDERERELVAVVDRAHTRVHKQRAAIQPTEAIELEELRTASDHPPR